MSDNVFSHKKTQGKSALSLLTNLRHDFGFTGMFNPHIMILISSDLKPRVKDMMLWIIHQTIGWNRTQTYFDVGGWSTETGWSKSSIYTSLNTLENKKVISRSNRGRHNKSSGILMINPDYRFWDIQYNVDLVNGSIANKHRDKKKVVIDSKKESSEEIDKLLEGL